MVYGSLGPGCNNIFTTEYLVISHKAVCSLDCAWSCGGTCTFALYNTGLCNWPCDQWPCDQWPVISYHSGHKSLITCHGQEHIHRTHKLNEENDFKTNSSVCSFRSQIFALLCRTFSTTTKPFLCFIDKNAMKC